MAWRRIARLPGLGGRRVALSAEAPAGYRLEVHSRGGCVEVELVEGAGFVRVKGEARFVGGVTLEQRDDVVVVRASRASARVEAGGAEALVAVVRGGCLRVRGDSGPLLGYVALDSSASAVSVRARLGRGGGLLARLSASSAKLEAVPEGPGEYWLELRARASSVAVRFDAEGVEYVLEGPAAASVSVEPERPGDSVKVRAVVDARMSSVALR